MPKPNKSVIIYIIAFFCFLLLIFYIFFSFETLFIYWQFSLIAIAIIIATQFSLSFLVNKIFRNLLANSSIFFTLVSLYSFCITLFLLCMILVLLMPSFIL